MRQLAIARFRLLTIIRTATPIFLIAIVPPVIGANAMSTPEPEFRASADELIGSHALFSFLSWFWHAVILSFACLMSGKIKSSHDDVMTNVIPDLMDTAPVGRGARFWGEALGTLGAVVMIHVCCLPLLAAVAALSPFPTVLFLWMEAATIALIALASAGAAWQRRAPRTKYSGTRGLRNAVCLAILFFAAFRATTRWEVFRDATVEFLEPDGSMRNWPDVRGAVENPFLLFTLLSLLYAGTIAYYYVSSTRKQQWEN